MIDFSKIRKAPAPQHLEFKYGPIAPTREQLAASAGFADLVSKETDAAIARLHERVEHTLRTPFGDIRVTADPSLALGEVVLARPCGVRSTHHSHKCERPRGHADVHVGRGCSWGEDAVDPLDIEYSGVPLRTLLEDDELRRHDHVAAMCRCRCSTPAQRAAVSAHWSAELRARVAASAERERCRVVVDLQDEP